MLKIFKKYLRYADFLKSFWNQLKTVFLTPCVRVSRGLDVFK